jgi:hypothetical protein
MAAGPGNVAPPSIALLVANNSVNGTINAFDLATGKFVGTVKGAARCKLSSGRPR